MNLALRTAERESRAHSDTTIEEFVESVYARADRDKDDRLSYKEFLRAVQHYPQLVEFCTNPSTSKDTATLDATLPTALERAAAATYAGEQGFSAAISAALNQVVREQPENGLARLGELLIAASRRA